MATQVQELKRLRRRLREVTRSAVKARCPEVSELVTQLNKVVTNAIRNREEAEHEAELSAYLDY